MMKIVYFTHKERFLQDMELQGNPIFIAPSPAKADNLRGKLKPATGDVITIAKFTANILNALDAKPEVKRKSELLLIFGILKNKYFPELGYEQFTQAYNLFSDLRSFTLSLEALTSILEEHSAEIQKAVLLFWQLLEVTGYLDEHGAYHFITESLRSAEEIEGLKKTYVFWGFQHLNGQQVDLIKALSIRYDVIIPFPYALKDKVKKSDWISWMKGSEVDEEDLVEDTLPAKASWLPINSREISSNLSHVLKSGDQIILGVSKLTPSHMDYVPSTSVGYKIPHQLIQAELNELKDELKGFTEYLELTSYLENCKTKSMKKLKALQLYQEAIDSLAELTDEAIKVDSFFLKLLQDVVNLNQPRTSYVPMSSAALEYELKDMSSLEDVSRDRRIVICLDERFDDIQGLGQNYTESIQKALASLGPLKRNELELLFRQWEFRDLFSRGEVLVLMSESILKHSLVWKRLFTDIELSKITKEKAPQSRKILDHFQDLSKKTYVGNFSASKFQTFLDCPRKFYFTYVDKVFPNITLVKDFDSLTSGTIIHKIIEEFYHRNLQESELPNLIKELMDNHIKLAKLTLPADVYLQRSLIFYQRSLNGINFLKNIDDLIQKPVHWKIEEDFKLNDGYILSGKMDCLGVTDNYIFLLDFKSTKSAASTNKEVEELESLQLWAYAKAAAHKVSDFNSKTIILGYVVLDDPSESNLLVSDESTFNLFKSAKLFKSKKFKLDFFDLMKQSSEKMHSLTLAIASEASYLAKPRKSGTCHFCELNKVCVKSEMAHE